MRPLFAVAGWIAAATVAIGIGITGVQAIGAQIAAGTGGHVLTAEEARRELARTDPVPAGVPPASAAPSSPEPAPDRPANERSFAGAGGTVTAGCYPTGAYLVNWSPAQGYGVKQTRRGPDPEYAEVRFERGGSGGSGDSRVRVTCIGGVPTARWN